jgi:hypothetical protein
MHIIEDFEEWAHHRHRQTSAAPAAATATIEATTGGPVISVAEIENDIKTVAAKFEQVDKAALGKLEMVQANPKTNEAFELIAAVAHVDPGPFFDGAVNILRLLAGQAASVPSFTPAGPQVAGQA